METPLELLKQRLSVLETLANQRGFYRAKKDAAKVIPLYRKAIQLMEAELNQAEVIKSVGNGKNILKALEELRAEFTTEELLELQKQLQTVL